jgi:hypothetical protein
LKGEKLAVQIREIEGRLVLNPAKLELIQARIKAINDNRKYRNALLALRKATAEAKSGGERSKAFQNYKLNVLRSSKQDIGHEEASMRRAMEAMLRANAKAAPLDAKIHLHLLNESLFLTGKLSFEKLKLGFLGRRKNGQSVIQICLQTI